MRPSGGSPSRADASTATSVRGIVTSVPAKPASASSASTTGGGSIAWGTARLRLCKSILLRRNLSIIFCPAARSFRLGQRAATWAASSVKTGISPSRGTTRCIPPSFLPEDVSLLAIQYGCDSIAFTYNEPTIWGEYVVDICRAAKQHGLNTVMVSNGYITREAFWDIYDHVDAANIDLKAFSESFYSRMTLTHLQPVLDTLEWLKNETNVWFEITNLMIPTLNDDPGETRKLAEWILEHLGPDVPLHFTAIHPDFKLQDKPRTPPETLHRAREIAREVGLHYVYEGNIFSGGANTECPRCGVVLIRRSWHNVEENRLRDGRCSSCGHAVPGRWTNLHGRALPKVSNLNATSGKYADLNL